MQLTEKEQDDIISGIQIASTLFHKPQEMIKDLKDPSDLVKTIFGMCKRDTTISVMMAITGR